MGSLAKNILQVIISESALEEKDIESLDGYGCLGTFCVNQDGVPFAETFTVASFVLGVKAYRNSASLDGLTRCLDNALKDFDERRFALKPTEESEKSAMEGHQDTIPIPEEKTGTQYIPFTW